MEFGSDFNTVINFRLKAFHPYLPEKSSFFANGRQALLSILKHNNFKRIWIPNYYCYDVVDYLRNENIEILFYHQWPRLSSNKIYGSIGSISFAEGDVLLRVNTFGLNKFKADASSFAVPVIDDITHDLCGQSAISSTADWCFASLRKTLPIPEGGILWSPKNHALPSLPQATDEINHIVKRRAEAMALKTSYLKNLINNKEEFLHQFQTTEHELVNSQISCISNSTKDFLLHFDIQRWYLQKKLNWLLLSEISSDKAVVIKPDNIETCYPLSLLLLFNTPRQRDIAKEKLISKAVYPAILWKLPVTASVEAMQFSETMMSIPCDARYNQDDILHLKSIIEQVLSDLQNE